MGMLKENAGAIIGGLTTLGGWLGIGEGRQDKRQVNQQTKLNEVNAKTTKELADYEQALKLKMWKDTNYGGQLEQAGLAGVSKAAAIGGSGTGTQGASVGGVSGGGAADAASTTNARTAQQQMGMQLASQLALQQAQKENIEADTANKKAGEGLTKEDIEKRKMDTLTQGEVYTKTIAESQLANRTLEAKVNKEISEAGIKNNEQIESNKTLQDKIKQAGLETINKTLKNKQTSIENRIKTAEAEIKQFEKNMTDRGISTNAPWYIKLIGDWQEKLRIMTKMEE